MNSTHKKNSRETKLVKCHLKNFSEKGNDRILTLQTRFISNEKGFCFVKSSGMFRILEGWG